MSAVQNEILTMGTFLLDGSEFGVNLLQQREVLRMVPVTKIPRATDFLEGVINQRGRIIPVVNLRKRFGIPSKEFDGATRIINIEVTDTLVVGFIVDSVGQVRRMDASMVEPAPPVVSSVEAEYISGVGKFDGNLLIILDIAKVLTSGEIEQMEHLM